MSEKQIYVLLGLQEDFTHKDSQFHTAETDEVVRKNAELLEFLKSTGNHEHVMLTQRNYSQDHVSFTESHPGIAKLVEEQNIDLSNTGLDIVYDADTANIVGLAVKQADTTNYYSVSAQNGRIEQVSFDQAVSAEQLAKNTVLRSLHSEHCVRGSAGAAFSDDLKLPKFTDPLLTLPLKEYRDDKLHFHVADQGAFRNKHAEGLAANTNKYSYANLDKQFYNIARQLSRNGVTKTTINLGGLATESEFTQSIRDLRALAHSVFKEGFGIDATIQFMPEHSAVIDEPGKKKKSLSDLSSDAGVANADFEAMKRAKEGEKDFKPSKGAKRFAFLGLALAIIGIGLATAAIFMTGGAAFLPLIIAGASAYGAGLFMIGGSALSEETRRNNFVKAEQKADAAKGQGQEKVKAQTVEAEVVKDKETQTVVDQSLLAEQSGREQDRTAGVQQLQPEGQDKGMTTSAEERVEESVVPEGQNPFLAFLSQLLSAQPEEEVEVEGQQVTQEDKHKKPEAVAPQESRQEPAKLKPALRKGSTARRPAMQVHFEDESLGTGGKPPSVAQHETTSSEPRLAKLERGNP